MLDVILKLFSRQERIRLEDITEESVLKAKRVVQGDQELNIKGEYISQMRDGSKLYLYEYELYRKGKLIKANSSTGYNPHQALSSAFEE